MKNVFNEYAKYYDLIYKGKNYKREAEYVLSLIEKYSKDSKTILDLGCGTGSYSVQFAQKGYSVTGVDISSAMISIAQQTHADKSNLKFVCQSAQKLRLKTNFDVAVSLFHVMSYQTTNDMLVQAFRNIYRHLKMDGVFIFDFWYGPAVLTSRPGKRQKILENSDLRIKRDCIPQMNPNLNTVDVAYKIHIENKQEKKIRIFRELHQVRYLFYPELLLMLQTEGFVVEKFNVWMSEKKVPDFNSWYALMVVRKVNKK